MANQVIHSLIYPLNNKFTFTNVNVPTTDIPSGLFSVSVTVSKAGYTAIGIISFNLSRKDGLLIQGISANGDNAIINGYNTGSATNITGSIRVLYQST